MKEKINYSFLIVIIAVFLSLWLRMAAVWNNNFPFTMDQGRDMVDIRSMVVTHTPRLVGPTTSINGVLLGPAWYYFLLTPFLLSNGNPAAILFWQILWYQFSAIFLWWSLSKYNQRLGLICSVLFLFMPVGFYANRYFWNANAMLIFTAFFFGMLFLMINKPSSKKALVTGILAGISLQIEAAFGIIFFPFVFFFLTSKKSGIKNLAALSSGFFITLLPQILFEIRHQFIMTKVLIAEFSGDAAVLGEKIDLSERVGERYSALIKRVVEISHFHPSIIITVFFLGLLVGTLLILSKKKSALKDYFSVSILFLIFSGMFYLAFPQHLKGWYLLGLSVPLIIIVSLS